MPSSVRRFVMHQLLKPLHISQESKHLRHAMQSRTYFTVNCILMVHLYYEIDNNLQLFTSIHPQKERLDIWIFLYKLCKSYSNYVIQFIQITDRTHIKNISAKINGFLIIVKCSYIYILHYRTRCYHLIIYIHNYSNSINMYNFQ